MRKVLVLMAILIMPLMVTKAQDTASTQAPIFAIAEGKLYRVSVEDGSATLMTDTASDQIIAPLRVESISPDGKYLVYILQSTFDTKNAYKSDLFLMTIADGTTKTIRQKVGFLIYQRRRMSASCWIWQRGHTMGNGFITIARHTV